jgi:spectinomycin phosphotransferase
MLEKQNTISNQQIINCLITDYGIEVTTLTFLPLGADMNASVYKAQAADKTCHFVKLKHGHHHDISIAVTKMLHEAGIQQIIPPINTTYGQPIHYIDDFTLIVYPFVDGQNGFSSNLTDDQWIILGKALRQIHEIEVPSSIQNQIRREAYSPKWRNIVKHLFIHIETALIDDEMAITLMRFMKENANAIFRLVDRAQELGQKLKDQPTKFVLCHSDIHGGNVLINGNNPIYIVDWDDPIMAPKERDLMFIGGGVANVWNKPHEEEFFYKGYGVTEVNVVMLAYYRHERIVEDIAIYGQELLLTKARSADRQEMFKQFVAMFEPHGVVDIAFKTDIYYTRA